MSGSRLVSHRHGYLDLDDLFFCRYFLCSPCHLFLISSASLRRIPFLSFVVPILERSYSKFKVRRGGHEEILLVQVKEQQLCFAGTAVKRYPMSKGRETQVRR